MSDWMPPTPTPRPINPLPEGMEIEIDEIGLSNTMATESIQAYNIISKTDLMESINWLMVVLTIIIGFMSVFKRFRQMANKDNS